MKLPIIFHPKYDIGLFGLENRHPFDSKKYGKVFKFLQDMGIIVGDNYFQPAAKVSDEVLLQVHTPLYLQWLRQSKVIAAIAEMHVLSWVPNFVLQWKFLDPMRWATAGTIAAVDLALQYGWAINLSGGYHHAKAQECSGFCFFADINLAAQKAFQAHPHVQKIMVIDLDAHQGNGFEAVFKDDPRVDTFDMYNGAIYPQDFAAAKYIRWKHALRNRVGEAEYLDILNKNLPQAIQDCCPDLIIYNAGSDPYEKDALGGMRITAAGLIQRDETVFRLARQQSIPIMMVLSGGYHRDSASIIAQSIQNLWKKGLLQASNSIA